MRKILFASYGGLDFSMISPVFPFLREKGYRFAILNRYDLAPSRRQTRGLTVFEPPDVSDRLLSADEIETALETFLDTRSVRHLLPLWHGQTPGLRFLPGWSDHYFDFVAETLNRYDPDLVVASIGEAETSIIQRVCDLTSRKLACMVPQRYEFKSLESFEAHEATTYMVAGEYGKARLIGKGVRPEDVRVTGNPRFDRLSTPTTSSARSAEKIILYPLQAVRGEERLFELLRRYVSSRKGVRLALRPHPNLPLRTCLPFLRHVVTEPISLALRGTLDRHLGSADVLVTMWSLTVLEALIVGLPVISWKSDFFPAEMPFASRGDTLLAHDYAKLEGDLDRLLFDKEFRRTWIEAHRECHVAYVGALDGKAARRVADAIEALVEGGTAARAI